MVWYGWLFLGVSVGLIISRYLPAKLQINGKVKQKGRNTSNNISDIKIKPKRAENRKKLITLKRREKNGN